MMRLIDSVEQLELEIHSEMKMILTIENLFPDTISEVRGQLMAYKKVLSMLGKDVSLVATRGGETE